MNVIVGSKVHKKTYEIKRMSEYDIETSLDIPADSFNIVIENPIDEKGYGVNADIFNANDSFKISESYGIILDGASDDVEEYWDENRMKYGLEVMEKRHLLLNIKIMILLIKVFKEG